MRFIRIAGVAIAAGLILAACSGGDSPSENATTTTQTSATSAATSTATETSSSATETTAPSTGLILTAPVGASNTGFTEKELSAPADTPFTITFNNDDAGIPHNVQIFAGTDTTVTPTWAPENNALINGVATETYEVTALAAGAYTFNCFAHPATMVGTLTVA